MRVVDLCCSPFFNILTDSLGKSIILPEITSQRFVFAEWGIRRAEIRLFTASGISK